MSVVEKIRKTDGLSKSLQELQKIKKLSAKEALSVLEIFANSDDYLPKALEHLNGLKLTSEMRLEKAAPFLERALSGDKKNPNSFLVFLAFFTQQIERQKSGQENPFFKQTSSNKEELSAREQKLKEIFSATFDAQPQGKSDLKIFFKTFFAKIIFTKNPNIPTLLNFLTQNFAMTPQDFKEMAINFLKMPKAVSTQDGASRFFTKETSAAPKAPYNFEFEAEELLDLVSGESFNIGNLTEGDYTFLGRKLKAQTEVLEGEKSKLETALKSLMANAANENDGRWFSRSKSVGSLVFKLASSIGSLDLVASELLEQVKVRKKSRPAENDHGSIISDQRYYEEVFNFIFSSNYAEKFKKNPAELKALIAEFSDNQEAFFALFGAFSKNLKFNDEQKFELFEDINPALLLELKEHYLSRWDQGSGSEKEGDYRPSLLKAILAQEINTVIEASEKKGDAEKKGDEFVKKMWQLYLAEKKEGEKTEIAKISIKEAEKLLSKKYLPLGESVAQFRQFLMENIDGDEESKKELELKLLERCATLSTQQFLKFVKEVLETSSQPLFTDSKRAYGVIFKHIEENGYYYKHNLGQYIFGEQGLKKLLGIGAGAKMDAEDLKCFFQAVLHNYACLRGDKKGLSTDKSQDLEGFFIDSLQDFGDSEKEKEERRKYVLDALMQAITQPTTSHSYASSIFKGEFLDPIFDQISHFTPGEAVDLLCCAKSKEDFKKVLDLFGKPGKVKTDSTETKVSLDALIDVIATTENKKLFTEIAIFLKGLKVEFCVTDAEKFSSSLEYSAHEKALFNRNSSEEERFKKEHQAFTEAVTSIINEESKARVEAVRPSPDVAARSESSLAGARQKANQH